MDQWNKWVETALSKLQTLNLIRHTHPISLSSTTPHPTISPTLHHHDRSSVEVHLTLSTYQQWLKHLPTCSEQEPICLKQDPICLNQEPICLNQEPICLKHVSVCLEEEPVCENGKVKLVLFSGNDYLGLSSHPAVRKAAVEAARDYGMGPRGSALICGYTDYHMRLEDTLADLKNKEDCLICPTGFAANMAFMSALGSISSLLAVGRKPSKDERVAIFSDALNHASIIDGIRLAERQQEVKSFVYRHCDTVHLDDLLSCCTMEKKVVVTDSLFSMDGDFAPITELVELRKKHKFLLVIDDAHATLVCGKNGGGVPELYECEDDIDICTGTLSKAVGCQGGFIACSKQWKQLIQSRGRSFIFSTSLPVPIAAASHAAILVGQQEKWRRKEIWKRVAEFRSLTRVPITSQIISIIIGSEDSALRASRHMLKSGFHVTAIRPPTVPPNSCRLRITLSAAHTAGDIRRLVAALTHCVKFPDIKQELHIDSRL